MNVPDPYKVTSCIVYDTIEEKFNEHRDWKKTLLNYKLQYTDYEEEEDIERCLPEIFSILVDDIDIENKTEYIYTVNPITMTDECFEEYQRLIEEQQDSQQMVKLHVLKTCMEEVVIYKKEFPIEFYKEMLNLLPSEYAIERDKWINIGWIVFNIFNEVKKDLNYGMNLVNNVLRSMIFIHYSVHGIKWKKEKCL